jgi:hypothetical protein
MEAEASPSQKLQELRLAVRDLQERGLCNSAKWAAEHAVALQPVRCAQQPRARLLSGR